MMDKARQKELMEEILEVFDEIVTTQSDAIFELNRYQIDIQKLCDEEFSPVVLNFAMALSKKITSLRIDKDSFKLARLSDLTYGQFRVLESSSTVDKARQKELMRSIEEGFNEIVSTEHDAMFILNRYQINIEKLCDEEFSPEVLNFAMSLSEKLTSLRLKKDSFKLVGLSNLTYEQFRVLERE
ncbi:MAG: hypothetical protein MJ236_07500, partial [Clostridia bacterium]|nr:hypothetical protein [Clostridia bacterium]